MNKYKFQVGDEVKILPGMTMWTYCVLPMEDYINLTARILDIEDDDDIDVDSDYKVWLDIDDHKYFWNPDYLELISVPVELDETTLFNLL